jgi:hypothetical protein
MEKAAKDPLAHLALADPKLAEALAESLEKRLSPLSPEFLGDLADFVLRSISMEISFGEAVARSLAQLAENATPEILAHFQQLVEEAAVTGPALAKLMATHSAPVLMSNTPTPGLLEKFTDTVGVMLAKGIHTLYESLACVSELLTAGDIAGSDAFLDLLKDTFAPDLSYGLTRHFAHALPTATASFDQEKRLLLLRQLRRVMVTDTGLVDAFLDGISRGLPLLSDHALNTFVSRGLQKAAEKPASGRNFLSLSSAVARTTLRNLQTAVPLAQARPGLQRYLQARIGSRLAVKSISDLPAPLREFRGTRALACTDGQRLYLAGTLDRYESQAGNMALYRTLARLESAHIEFGTFDFDLQRLRDACPELPIKTDTAGSRGADLSHFFALFPSPNLALDLFTIFEHGRVFRQTAARYPGLVRRVKPALKEEMRLCFGPAPKDPRRLLYAGVMLGADEAARLLAVPNPPGILQALWRCFDETEHGLVISSARLAADAYPQIADLLNHESGDAPFLPPFGRQIRPDLFDAACRHLEPLIDRLQAELRRQGRQAFRSDIRNQLLENNGRLSRDGLTAILDASRPPGTSNPGRPIELYERLAEDLPDLFDSATDTYDMHPREGDRVFWYREWNAPTCDYLDRHVRLVEHLPPAHAGDMFEEVLKEHTGMVLNIRRAFELLKPQELALLRHWPDGDDIDLPALMATVADRKAGHTPSNRIYLKRAKQVRDVAVLLLVDQSGSTKNIVPGTDMSVLTLEKEAIVLFCEALRVVGDDFAISGFSSRGRLQVDYYRYKDFDEPVTREVRRRISGMTPQRNTRTGAALRHAARALSRRPSKVRLLILLSDGFPNDTGYKRDHAVSDVQKAVSEAAAGNVHVRPITVNLLADKSLDHLYGRLHHNVISDVRELPDTLWRIYCALTK